MIDTVKENLCINRIVGSKTFAVTVEGDCIIPDTKPDILNEVYMTGNVCIYKKEILEGKIRLDGNVNVYLMYLADSDAQMIRGVNGNIDFTEILDFPGVDSRMMLDEEITIKKLECKVLNGRKINLKAFLEIKADVFLNENEEIIKQINNIDDVQSQIVPLTINSLVGQNTTKAIAKETVVIDNTDVLSEILSIDFNITNKDTKVSYNKVLAKADMEVRIIYLTDDGRIKGVEETIPVMGFIDLVGVSDENLCDVKYKLKNVVIKPNSPEEHSIYVEIELELFCRVFENKEVNIIQDMYSPSRNLTFKENKVSTMVNMRNTSSVMNVTQKVRLENSEYTKICDVSVTPVINETNVSRDRVRFSGELDLDFILTNNNSDNIITLNQNVPFEFTQEIDGITAESRVTAEIVPIFREFVSDNMEVAAKIDLNVSTNSYNLETVNVIDNIEEAECGDDDIYSMVIYFVKPGDTLWKIAKRYRSTVEDIARVNNIENPDRINVGQQLFIPKCSMCRT